MMVHNSLKWAVTAAISMLLLACGGGSTATDGQTPQADPLDTVRKTDASLMKIGGKLFSIPSPVQTALLIRKLGLPYQKELPMSNEAVDKMATKAQRALALGAYGADLAYVTVHKDGQRALNTLQTVQKLSGQLELSNAFDQTLLDGFKKSLNNEDSLLRFTGTAFRAADRYLKDNDRNDVSALVLTGGWLEGMFLIMSGPADKMEATLTNRVGEQRRTLENLIALLGDTDTEKTQGTLIAGLKDLLTAFDGVSTTYTFETPTVDAAHKTTYINSTSTVTMAPEKFKAIGDKVKALRSTLTA